MNNLYGLVMCGGQSSRMGRDKGLIKTTNTSWVEKSYALLQSLGLPTYISINESQRDNYQFNEERCILDKNIANGPLRGLLSAHQEHPSKDFFILACDMQLMTQDTLKKVEEAYRKHLLHIEAIAYKNLGQLEPLCGIYTHNALEKANKRLHQGSLTSFSLKNILNSVNTYFLNTALEDPFHNLNTEADIIQFS